MLFKSTLGLLLPCLLLLGACTSHPVTSYPEPVPAERASEVVDSALEAARRDNMLAMLVLGANWCHDSTDFIALTNEAGLADWLQQHYRIQFINVGYLDHVREYLEPFDVAVLYGTPTVLIVDPDTRSVVNRDSAYYWRNASSLDSADARRYFSRYLSAPPQDAGSLSPALAAALERIHDFERQQAQRIYQAYAVLGPEMAKMESGEPEPGFEANWVNLAKMRGAITGDLAALRASARQQDAAGKTDIELDFPAYSLFID